MNYIVDTLGRTTMCNPNSHVFVEPYSICDCGGEIRYNYEDFSLSYSNYLSTEIKEILNQLIYLLVKENKDGKKRSIA